MKILKKKKAHSSPNRLMARDVPIPIIVHVYRHMNMYNIILYYIYNYNDNDIILDVRVPQ